MRFNGNVIRLKEAGYKININILRKTDTYKHEVIKYITTSEDY